MLPVLVIFLNGISTSRISGFDGLNDNAEVSSRACVNALPFILYI